MQIARKQFQDLLKQLAIHKTSALGPILIVSLIVSAVFMTFSSLHPFIGQPSISSKVEVLVIVLVLTAIILLAYFFFRHVQFLNQKIYRQEQTIKQRQMLLSNLSHNETLLTKKRFILFYQNLFF